MRDLQEIRPLIDELDRQLVDLFIKRMGLCGEVAEYKAESGKQVFDKDREKSKLDSLKSLADTEFNAHCVGEMFTQLMAMSRKMQYRILSEKGMLSSSGFEPVIQLKRSGCKVIYQGVEGAYSQQAMFQFFGSQTDHYNVQTWREAMEGIRDEKADYAVLPIENSSAGIVNDTYDLLNEFDNCIVAEIYLKIDHALLGLPGAELSDIRTVYSHPQGLMQCIRFLEEHKDWQQIGCLNTAAAAKKVLEDGDKSQAAIASETAGALYGMNILKKQLNHNQENTTRFVVISSRKVYLKSAKKISICFEIPHASGTLYNMLSHIIFNNLSMSKIESRPIEGRNWEYRFFVDIEGNLGDAAVVNALRGIEEEASGFKILGNY